jgi:5-methylcytosine-specific restriction endonuclease McrA
MLDSNVLVLNKVFQAVQIVTARKAFTLFCKGHVRAVLEDYRTCAWEDWKDIPVGANDEFVCTPQSKIKIPRVILLLSFDRVPRHDVKFSRKNIYLRDKNKCQYCGKRYRTDELNLDHVVPVSRGGRSTWENVVCSCIRCNIRKGNRSPEEAGMALVMKPLKPRWHPLVRASCRYEEWKSFLDEAYWNAEIDEEGA